MSTKDTTTTVVVRPKQGKKRLSSNLRAHKVMSAYLIRVVRAHNLPSLEVPARDMTIDRIRALPIKGKCGCTGKKLDSAAP